MNSKKIYRFFLLLCLVVGFGGISTSEISAHILCRKVVLGKVIDACPHSPSSHSAPAKPATSKPARSIERKFHVRNNCRNKIQVTATYKPLGSKKFTTKHWNVNPRSTSYIFPTRGRSAYISARSGGLEWKRQRISLAETTHYTHRFDC